MEIVLVHGAGGRPTTWSAVAPLLAAQGHHVITVTNPMTSLDDDVANTLAAVEATSGPVLLAGHSYGGAVITNAGRHPRVRALVYIAAFAPEEGETVNGIVERYEPAEISRHMRRGANGDWKSEPGPDFWAEIGWDLSPEQRSIVEAEGRAAEDLIFKQATGAPAWRTLPSWYLLAEQDRTLRPEIQADMAHRMGATLERVPGSHYTTLVHPDRVAAIITAAVSAVAP
ncbi:alpha/beta fold hydrolase [Nonomuraea insulae]|uniref:Alpha/beta fold hydrolase n=1 Tax=Nonomuraea insulae TaxID=1616787 RepID=A0ABW1D7M7_9ACTN